LWQKSCKKTGKGCVAQLWNARNERGFDFRQFGNTDYLLTEFEGLALVTRMRRPPRKSVKKEAAEAEMADV